MPFVAPNLPRPLKSPTCIEGDAVCRDRFLADSRFEARKRRIHVHFVDHFNERVMGVRRDPSARQGTGIRNGTDPMRSATSLWGFLSMLGDYTRAPKLQVGGDQVSAGHDGAIVFDLTGDKDVPASVRAPLDHFRP